MPEMLGWLRPVIEKIMPIFGMLHTAELVNSNPFPAQVVTLYTIITWLPVLLWNIYCVFFIDNINNRLSLSYEVMVRCSDVDYSRKIFIKVLLVVIIILVSYPFMSLVHQYKPIPRTSYLEYSLYPSVSVKMLYIYFPISFALAGIKYLFKLMSYLQKNKQNI